MAARSLRVLFRGVNMFNITRAPLGSLGLIFFLVTLLSAQTPAGTEFFEKEIRPVFAEKCYGCHSSKLKSPMGGLVLDTKAGLKKGGNGGADSVAGRPRMPAACCRPSPTTRRNCACRPPANCRMKKSPRSKNGSRRARRILARTLRKLPARLPPPRSAAWISRPAASGGPSSRSSRNRSRSSRNAAFAKRWTREKIDWFILARLEQNKLQPSPEADRATLIQRASLDLTGLRPSYEEVQAFVADQDPKAYEKLIDRLLASPHYGERWGRYWLDVARYGEDNPTSRSHQSALSVCLAVSRLGDRGRSTKTCPTTGSSSCNWRPT